MTFGVFFNIKVIFLKKKGGGHFVADFRFHSFLSKSSYMLTGAQST